MHQLFLDISSLRTAASRSSQSVVFLLLTRAAMDNNPFHRTSTFSCLGVKQRLSLPDPNLHVLFSQVKLQSGDIFREFT